MNMERKVDRALVIVDEQNDFINGSLAVAGAERIIEPTNKLIRAYGHYGLIIATTQDWHPKYTAHFSDTPNYVDTWPVHCVAGTYGSQLHDDLEITQHHAFATRFIKGVEPCSSPADDTSYTGILARSPELGLSLPQWLERHEVTRVDVIGLALGDGAEHPLCVDSTAIDLNELGYKVNVVTDAVEAVLPENRAKCFENLARRGIQLATLDETLASLAERAA